jgi:alpha-mannosidase
MCSSLALKITRNGFVLFAFTFLSLIPTAFAQSAAAVPDIAVKIDDVGQQDTTVAEHYVSGYSSFVAGETIEYHSADPDVTSALLVRGKASARTISWETDPVPDTNGSFKLIWLSGVECAGFAGETSVHTFYLLINGEQWFAFQNRKDSSAKHWAIPGRDGSELTFDARMTDNVGDLFGYMVLKLPVGKFPTHERLKLTVVGDDSESADWFMTFQHPFAFTPKLRSEPALLNDHGRESQLLRISIDNLVAGRIIDVRVAKLPSIQQRLEIGGNVIQVPVPPVQQSTKWHVDFELNGKHVETSEVVLLPVKKREIYLLSYSHNDIGYTDRQQDVEKKQWDNLEVAMRLIRESRSFPPNARFKWNLETNWALESWLRKATPEQKQEFFGDVTDGSIGISALFANMLTGLANPVEMSHFYDFARELREQYKLPMDTAVTSDVPGFTWGIVSAMAQSGIKYFATAPNSGDRIGYTLKAWGDKPFYWQSQSGQERVLTWMAGASYSTFHEGKLSALGDEKIMKFMRRLEESQYPYDIVQLPYTLGDNAPPDPTLAQFVKSWNERYTTPRLVLATHAEMFRKFESKYGNTLPIMRGDFTPYWEDGAASTARETMIARVAVDRLIQGQALWSMLDPGGYPAADYSSAWRDITFWDEHTWGAHNSTEEPDLPFVKDQWEFKRKFAESAYRESSNLLAGALSNRNTIPNGFEVLNTNSWTRTDLVSVPAALSGAGDQVTTISGERVPSQRLSSGELAVLVKDLAPFSSRTFLVHPEKYSAVESVHAGPDSLENEFLMLTVNPDTGAIDSLKSTSNARELVDKARGGLGRYWYVPGTDPKHALSLSNVRIRIKERGPVLSSLLVEADAPGAKKYSAEIRVIAGLERVDFAATIDKRAIRELEGVHFGFPLAFKDAEVRYDVANAIVRPTIDQLNGACKNFFSVQSWVDVSDPDYGVTWATPNAPLFEMGAITAESPWMESIQTSSHLYSYVMNNYWHTNYKADQEGLTTFHYSLELHGAFDSANAVKFGTDMREPLIVQAASEPSKASLMQLLPSGLVVLSIRPVSTRSWIVFLYNPTSAAQDPQIQWRGDVSIAVHSSDVDGNKLDENTKMSPYASRYFRVDLK